MSLQTLKKSLLGFFSVGLEFTPSCTMGKCLKSQFHFLNLFSTRVRIPFWYVQKKSQTNNRLTHKLLVKWNCMKPKIITENIFYLYTDNVYIKSQKTLKTHKLDIRMCFLDYYPFLIDLQLGSYKKKLKSQSRILCLLSRNKYIQHNRT